MKALIILLVILSTSFGCRPPATDQINRLSVGMSKQQVESILGEPEYTSAKANMVMLHYSLRKKPSRLQLFENPLSDYYVRLVNGRVESFGKLGDFDSTKDPTLNLNIKNR